MCLFVIKVTTCFGMTASQKQALLSLPHTYTTFCSDKTLQYENKAKKNYQATFKVFIVRMKNSPQCHLSAKNYKTAHQVGKVCKAFSKNFKNTFDLSDWCFTALPIYLFSLPSSETIDWENFFFSHSVFYLTALLLEPCFPFREPWSNSLIKEKLSCKTHFCMRRASFGF